MAELYLITGPELLGYVGVTRGDALTRFQQHVKDARRSRTRFYNALRRHGPAAFSVRTLVVGTWEYVLSLEDAVIKALGTMSPAGYNTAHGGVGGRQIDEVREKISTSGRARFQRPGEREANADRVKALWAQPEHREKMRSVHLGRRHSDSHKQAQSAGQARRWSDPAEREAFRARMRQWWAERRESSKSE